MPHWINNDSSETPSTSSTARSNGNDDGTLNIVSPRCRRPKRLLMCTTSTAGCSSVSNCSCPLSTDGAASETNNCDGRGQPVQQAMIVSKRADALPRRPEKPDEDDREVNDNAALEGTRSDTDKSETSNHKKHRRRRQAVVRFGHAEIREYAVKVGDHPYCRGLCPMTLSWEYTDAVVVPVKKETTSSRRRRSTKRSIIALPPPPPVAPCVTLCSESSAGMATSAADTSNANNSETPKPQRACSCRRRANSSSRPPLHPSTLLRGESTAAAREEGAKRTKRGRRPGAPKWMSPFARRRRIAEVTTGSAEDLQAVFRLEALVAREKLYQELLDVHQEISMLTGCVAAAAPPPPPPCRPPPLELPPPRIHPDELPLAYHDDKSETTTAKSTRSNDGEKDNSTTTGGDILSPRREGNKSHSEQRQRQPSLAFQQNEPADQFWQPNSRFFYSTKHFWLSTTPPHHGLAMECPV